MLINLQDMALEEDLAEIDDFFSTEDLEGGVACKPTMRSKTKKDSEEVALSITMMSMRGARD